jgi:O-antigen/teichoic acid export membrane protein
VAEVDPALASALTPERSEDDDIRDLAGGALVVFVGKLARLSRGGFLWVITLLCGADVQGLYTTAWAVCSTLNKLARFGLLRSVVHYVTAARSVPDSERRHEHAALGAGLLIAAVASGAVVLSAHLAADHIAAFYQKPIARAIRIMAFTAPFVAFAWVLTSATRALRIMRYEVYVRSVGGPLILFIGGAAVGLAGFGLEAIAWVQLTMAVGNLAHAVIYFRRHFSFGDSAAAIGRPTPLRAMLRFGLPVTLTDLVYSLLVQLDVLMLAKYTDAATVGIYVLSRRLASAVLKAPQAFDAIFSSVVSELSLQQRHAELGKRFVTVTRWIFTVNLPIAVCMLLIADPILQLLGSSKLAVAADLQMAIEVLFVLCVGMMIQSVFAVAEPLLAMSGRPGVNLVNNVIWLALNFALNLWLIEIYGIVGAAFGAAVAMVVVALLRVGEVYALRKVLPFRRSQFKPLLGGCLAAVPAWFLRDAAVEPLWRAVLPSAGFLVTYGATLAALRLELEDRMLLARFWRSIRRRIGGLKGA